MLHFPQCYDKHLISQLLITKTIFTDFKTLQFNKRYMVQSESFTVKSTILNKALKQNACIYNGLAVTEDIYGFTLWAYDSADERVLSKSVRHVHIV